MKFILCMLVMICGLLQAQTSIDITNPENALNISSYRLPDWGFSTFGFNAWANAKGDTRLKNKQALVAAVIIADLRLNGDYLYFAESEKQTLNANLDISTDRYFSSTTFFSEAQVDEFLDYDARRLSFGFSADWRRYFYRNNYLLAEAESNLYFNRQQNSSDEQGYRYSENTNARDNGNAHLKLGNGLGHYRNVTPIIRALRIRERLKALDSEISLNDKDVEKMAQHLAKSTGYQRVYDRSDKYFWQDFGEIAHLAALAPYEQFYLQDALSENIGQRFEGWSLAFGANFFSESTSHKSDQFSRYLDREEISPQTSTRRREVYGYWGPFFSAQWSKNLTLRHQLGLTAELGWDIYFRQENYHDIFGPDGEQRIVEPHTFPDISHYQCAVDYLWVLHDRLLWTNKLRAYATASQYDTSGYTPMTGSEVEPSDRGCLQRYAFDSAFSYYIENDFVLSSFFSFYWLKTQRTGFSPTSADQPSLFGTTKSEDWLWYYGISLTYYLDRKMF